MNDYNNSYELMHYGVKGMKWGKRMARGHAGPGVYLTRKSQLKGDKRDLEALNRGEHLSVGFTKKRQAAYDARDRKLLEKRIAKNEAHFAAKQAKKDAHDRFQKRLADLEKSGRGNDIDAVLARAKKYDSDQAKAKADYKQAKAVIKSGKTSTDEVLKKVGGMTAKGIVKKASGKILRDSGYKFVGDMLTISGSLDLLSAVITVDRHTSKNRKV